MSETRIHPETGKVLRRGVRPQTVIVGSLSRTVDVPGWYPDDESDGVHLESRRAHAGKLLHGSQYRPV